MKELRLSEELLLFAIDEKKGVVPLIKASLIKLGLAGAVLYELEDRGKLELDGDRVKVLDEDPTGDSILDKSLKKISASKKKKESSSLAAQNREKIAQSLNNTGAAHQRNVEKNR